MSGARPGAGRPPKVSFEIVLDIIERVGHGEAYNAIARRYRINRITITRIMSSTMTQLKKRYDKPARSSTIVLRAPSTYNEHLARLRPTVS